MDTISVMCSVAVKVLLQRLDVREYYVHYRAYRDAFLELQKRAIALNCWDGDSAALHGIKNPSVTVQDHSGQETIAEVQNVAQIGLNYYIVVQVQYNQPLWDALKLKFGSVANVIIRIEGFQSGTIAPIGVIWEIANDDVASLMYDIRPYVAAIEHELSTRP